MHTVYQAAAYTGGMVHLYAENTLLATRVANLPEQTSIYIYTADLKSILQSIPN